MNQIPTEILDIIFSYKKQLNLNEINKEMKRLLYTCKYCDNETSETINKVYINCISCDSYICSMCMTQVSNVEWRNRMCMECILEEIYYETIEEIIEDKLGYGEKDRFLSLVSEFDELEMMEIINMLKTIVGKKQKRQEIYDNIRNHIIENINEEITSDLEVMEDYN